MKKHAKSPAIVLVMAFLFLFTSQSYGQKWWPKIVKGSGKITTEERSIADFEKIKVSAGINVLFTVGPKALSVTADDNLHEYIITEVSNGTLKIGRKQNVNFKKFKKMELHVRAPHLSAISTSSGARFESKDVIKNAEVDVSASSGSDLAAIIQAKEMDISSSSGSKMDLRISSDTVDVSSSSGSNIDLDGRVRNIEMKASSGASIQAKELQSENCDAQASSAGAISISVSKHLDGRASSGGSIRYNGNPEVNRSVSSGGNVSPE